MEWIIAVQNAIGYIEAHILEEINYEDAAERVHISCYEFHRAFSFLSGMTVNTYIRRRRLSLAAQELVSTKIRVTELALKYGYDTPESFTKAFVRFHGASPTAVREEGAKIVLFNPLEIKITVEGGKRMEYRIVQTRDRQYAALCRQFRNETINDEDNHEIPDFWSECHEKGLVEALRELHSEGKRDLYGLCSPVKTGEDSFTYGIGVLLDEDAKPLDSAEMERRGYTLWDVKAGTYVVFECMGNADAIGETWSRFYREFLPQSGYRAEQATDYEIYYEKGPKDLFCELWIPITK